MDTNTRDTSLSSFDGLDPNATWTLFLVDMTGDSVSGVLEDWHLDIQMVPEPGTWVLLLLAGGLALVQWRRLGKGSVLDSGGLILLRVKNLRDAKEIYKEARKPGDF